MSTGTPGSRLDGPGPADLLWRQRFQNQHAYLIERMNKLEGKGAVYEDRTRKAEQAAATCSAATTEIRDLRARLQAFEEDEAQQKQNEMVSKMLSQQTRDTAILKDKMTRLDVLDSRYRDQEEDLGELRQTLGECVSIIHGLQTEVRRLQETGAAEVNVHANAVRDITTRLESFETRDEMRDRQLQNAHTKLNGLDTDNISKTLGTNGLREAFPKADKARSADRPPRLEVNLSSPTLSDSPVIMRAAPRPRPQPWRVVGHSHFTPARRIASPGPFTPTSQQNAQVPAVLSQTQSNPQAITLVDGSEDEGTISAYNSENPESPHRCRSAFTPRKKPRLNNDRECTRKQKLVSRVSKNATQNPQKIVVLPVAWPPQPAFVGLTPTKRSPPSSGKKLPKGRVTKGLASKQAPVARSTAQEDKISTQLTQSQTVQNLRRSARNLGPGASTDTQHVELGTDSLPRPVPSPLKKRKRAKPPSLEDLNWV